VAARSTLYRADMGSDREAEIRASVGAHHDLGPGYDDAVAEGLVERIGVEIDKRIEAQLRRYGAPYGPPVSPPPVLPPSVSPPSGAAEAAAQGYPVPSGYSPAGYQGHPGYPGYPGYQAYQAPPPRRPTARPPAQHSVAMTVIALGSLTLGVAGTAIVAHARNGGGQAVMVLLIWAVIAIVNVAYARRC
jgi:hypothetical protein